MWMLYAGIGLLVVILIVVFLASKKGAKKEINPLDKYVEHEAEVTETISDTLDTGKVRVDGIIVRAKKGGPGVINVGRKVKITGALDTSFLVKEIA